MGQQRGGGGWGGAVVGAWWAEAVAGPDRQGSEQRIWAGRLSERPGSVLSVEGAGGILKGKLATFEPEHRGLRRKVWAASCLQLTQLVQLALEASCNDRPVGTIRF
jgi:hypothetical protein